jgi:hypothetical protein
MVRADGNRRWRRGAFAGAVAIALLVGASCSRDEAVPQTASAAPSTQDAFRTALAANDPLINLDPPFVTLGPLDQRPYQCANGDTCQPQEQYVERDVSPQGVTNAQIAKFYIDNLAETGWRVEAAFCDDGKNEYAVVASKRTNSSKPYPGRFELFDKDKVRMRITMPAFGAESSFTLMPDASAYPTGVCPANITEAVDTARKAAEKTSPTTLKTPGSVPGTTPSPAP